MRNFQAKRWIAGLLLIPLTMSLSAPAAEAGRRYKNRGNGRGHSERVVYRDGYRPVYREVYRPVYRTRVIHRSSNDALAGFVGGLVIGAVLGSASSRSYGDSRRYDYYDPYCDERFDSLQSYRGHCGTHRHTYTVRVIEVRSGDCVDTIRYSDGGWRHCDDSYAYSGRGDYGYRDRDQGYRDRGYGDRDRDYGDRDRGRDYDDEDYDD